MIGNKILNGFCRLRYSLRVFLLAVTCLGLGLGWRASVVRKVEGSLRILERAGAEIAFPYSVSASACGMRYRSTELRRPYASLLFLGYRHVDLPESVALVEATEDEIALTLDVVHALNNASTIKSLRLSGRFLTLDSCRPLLQLRHVRSITLGGPVNDEAVPFLASLERVQEFELTSTFLSKGGVEWLQGRRPECKVRHWAWGTL